MALILVPDKEGKNLVGCGGAIPFESSLVDVLVDSVGV